MKSNRVRTLIRLCFTLLAGIVLGFVLLLAVYALPLEPMEANVRASIPALNGEWRREESYDQLVAGYMTTQLDNSTDAAMMLAATITLNRKVHSVMYSDCRLRSRRQPDLGASS